MFIIWIISFLNLVIGYIFKDYFPNNYYLTLFFIFLTTIILFFNIAKNYTRFLFIIFTSFIIRILFLIIDLKYRDVFIIPHSGNDTENFYNTGLLISRNLILLNESIYGGVYSKFLGLLFYVYGDDRVFAQYLNILFAITAILITIKILKMMNVSPKVQTIMVMIMAFLPHSIIFSSILLRESLISLLLLISLYFFASWFKKGNVAYAFLSILFVLIASTLHSAVVGITIGYLFAFIFYKRTRNKIEFSAQSVIPFSLFAILLSYTLIFPESTTNLPFFNKFTHALEDGDSIYDVASGSGRGGSAYLSSLQINNIVQLIMFSPIKMLYFFASPMPWDIRNFNDLISFLFDALFYIISFLLIIKNIKFIKKNPFLIIMVICLITALFIFGVGISNAGTALRHRFKLFYFVIIALGVLLTKQMKR